MNCARCSGYLAHINNLPRRRGLSRCTGCRPRAKMCAYLKGQCAPLRDGAIAFCYQCSSFPCPHLVHLDLRYRTRYGFSPIANLNQIKAHGLESFIKSENEGHCCSRCGGLLCIHNGKCYHCQEIGSWRG
jgi:hypothetical protein